MAKQASSKAPIVLGVDGGARNCGWAVIAGGKCVAGSTIRTNRDWHHGCWHDARRVAVDIATVLGGVIGAFGVTDVVLEEFSPVRNSGVASRIAMVFGAIVQEATCRGVNVYTRTPQDVRAVLGIEAVDGKDGVLPAVERFVADVGAVAEATPRSARQHMYDAAACAAVFLLRGGGPDGGEGWQGRNRRPRNRRKRASAKRGA